MYTYVQNNPLRYIDPSGNFCVSIGGKNTHAGQCSDPTNMYIDDKFADGLPLRQNGKDIGVFFVGIGGVRYGQETSLGVKGWSFRLDRAHEAKTGQIHLHVNGPKKQQWSQNEDGSPHDKDKNSPGSPPKSMKKELTKKLGWDWDAKKKAYDETHKFAYYPSESEAVYFSTQSDYLSFKMMYETGMIDINDYKGNFLYYLNGVRINVPSGSINIPIRIPRPALVP